MPALSVSHSVCLTLIYFTAPTGLEKEEASARLGAQTLLVTKTAIAEDKAGKNPPRSPAKAQGSQEVLKRVQENQYNIN